MQQDKAIQTEYLLQKTEKMRQFIVDKTDSNPLTLEEFVQSHPLSEFEKAPWYKFKKNSEAPPGIVFATAIMATNSGAAGILGAGVGYIAKLFNKKISIKNATLIGAGVGAALGVLRGAEFLDITVSTAETRQIDSYNNYLNGCLEPFRKKLGLVPGSDKEVEAINSNWASRDTHEAEMVEKYANPLAARTSPIPETSMADKYATPPAGSKAAAVGQSRTEAAVNGR